jgi:hypothetical protein
VRTRSSGLLVPSGESPSGAVRFDFRRGHTFSKSVAIIICWSIGSIREISNINTAMMTGVCVNSLIARFLRSSSSRLHRVERMVDRRAVATPVPEPSSRTQNGGFGSDRFVLLFDNAPVSATGTGKGLGGSKSSSF